jgi:ABC-2 type transport system ATP-binding protein
VRRDLLSAVLEYVSEAGATVFISSHLIHELERICDWVGVLDNGRLIAEMPMQAFKAGIKRLRVANAPRVLTPAPFMILSREAGNGVNGGAESWIVRGWNDPMRSYFERHGATLREVQDLDLEEGFVELLRTFRKPAA